MNILYYHLIIFLSLAGLLPAILTLGLDNVKFGLGPFCGWCIILISSQRILALSIRGKKKLISMTFWIYVYVFLGAAPMIQLMKQKFTWDGNYDEETILSGFLIIFIGLFFNELGRSVTLKKHYATLSLIKKAISRRLINIHRNFYVSLIGVATTTAFIYFLGGLDFLMLPRHQRLTKLLEYAGGESLAMYSILKTTLTVPIFVGLIQTLAHLNQGKLIKLKISHYITRYHLLLLILLIINILVNNPVNSARYWFGTIALSLSFYLIICNRRVSFAHWSAVIIFTLIFIFPFADMFRHTTKPDITDLIIPSKFSKQLIESGDYDGYQQILNSVKFVDDNGLSFGRQILGAVLVFVPRNIWTSKPLPSNVLVSDYMGYRYTNLTLPLWGEAYLDGAFLGVATFFFLYGIIVNTIERLYLSDQYSKISFLSVFVPVFAAYQIFFLRGALMPAFAYLVPIVIVMLISTRKEKYGG